MPSSPNYVHNETSRSFVTTNPRCPRCGKTKPENYKASWCLNCKAYRAKIKQYHKNKTKEQVKPIDQKFRDNNPGHAAKKNALKRAPHCVPSWSNEFIVNEFYRLARLRTKCLGRSYEVDHIIPLNGYYVNGFHSHDNLQILLQSENRRKYNAFIS